MIGHDELSRLYTLERLNKDGYINLDEVKTIDSEFAKDKLQKKDDTSTRTGGVLRQKKRDIFTSASTEVGADPDAFEMAQAWVKDGEAWFIQPALQEEHWTLASGEWDLISPSVQLASRILDTAEVLPFFLGLQPEHMSTLYDKPHAKKHGIEFKKWDVIHERRPSANTAAYLHMAGMRKKIQWRFTHIRKSIRKFATTEWNESSRTCIVSLNQDFLDILNRQINARQESMPWQPGTDVESAVLRTRVFLAITIVHEFTHCFWYIENGGFTPDPYFRDQPINEVGWEFERLFLAGMLQPTGLPGEPIAPYGLKIDRYPGPFIYDNEQAAFYVRATPKDWGIRRWSTYPVSMEWVSGLFTAELWDNVARNGIAAIKPDRKIGVRIRYGQRPAPRDRSLSPVHRAIRRLDEKERRERPVGAKLEKNVDSSDEEDEADDELVYRKDPAAVKRVNDDIKRRRLEKEAEAAAVVSGKGAAMDGDDRLMRELFGSSPPAEYGVGHAGSATPYYPAGTDSSDLFVTGFTPSPPGPPADRDDAAMDVEDTEMVDLDDFGIGSTER